MAKTGPKPQPTKLRLVRGNPGRRPIDANEPQPDAFSDAPPCPDWLGEVGRGVWADVCPKLMGSGLLTAVDVGVLAMYCEAWDEFFEAREHIAKHGLIAVGEKGAEYQHPAVGIKNKAIQRIKQIGAEFGMTPSSRTGISLTPQKAVDPLDQYLNQRQS